MGSATPREDGDSYALLTTWEPIIRRGSPIRSNVSPVPISPPPSQHQERERAKQRDQRGCRQAASGAGPVRIRSLGRDLFMLLGWGRDRKGQRQGWIPQAVRPMSSAQVCSCASEELVNEK